MSNRSPRYWLAALLLLISAALYALSLTMNVAMVETKIEVLGFSNSSTESVKLLSTIRTLWERSEMILVILITAFTIVFPIGKYLALLAVLRAKNPAGSRPLNWVKNFGQWSMGDVFVVALLVVILRVNSAVGQLNVLVEPGLYVFAASVLTSMIVSTLLAYEHGELAE